MSDISFMPSLCWSSSPALFSLIQATHQWQNVENKNVHSLIKILYNWPPYCLRQGQMSGKLLLVLRIGNCSSCLLGNIFVIIGSDKSSFFFTNITISTNAWAPKKNYENRIPPPHPAWVWIENIRIIWLFVRLNPSLNMSMDIIWVWQIILVIHLKWYWRCLDVERRLLF